MNTQALFSPNWYRVSDIAPWLASDVAIHRHVYRGEPSYVLHRRSTGSHYRMDVATFAIIDRFDGVITVDELWQLLLSERDEDAPTQYEMLSLLGSLHDADLLVVSGRMDPDNLFARRNDESRRNSKQRYSNPLYMRFALWDPEETLKKMTSVSSALFSKAGLYFYMALITLALFQFLPQLDLAVDEMATFDFLAPENLILFLFAYPLLKLVHEFAHALAVKRFGGEVHEFGIALLVLLPIPYMVASASTVFPHKYHRMLVAAAGMLLELGVAAIAAIVWANSTGLLHELALTLMLIGSVSTVFFNGNPLLKFDGYFLLADYLEIPNLAEKSKRYLSTRVKILLFGHGEHEDIADRGLRFWLISYAASAGVYRIVLMVSIAWMLSGRYFLFGVALALFVLFTSVLLPLYKMFRGLYSEPRLGRLRVTAWTVGAPALLLGAALFIPLPNITAATGVVWLPDESVVRVNSSCEVIKVHQLPGSDVQKGDSLFVCDDPALETRGQVLQAKLDQLNAQMAGLVRSDPLEFASLQRESLAVSRSLEDTRNRISDLTATARTDGRFDVVGSAQLDGRFLEAGSIAAYVVPENARTVRVAVPETETLQLSDVRRVSLRVAHGRHGVFKMDSEITRQAPKATTYVPSPALTTFGGGQLEADPESNGDRLSQPAYDVELAWPGDTSSAPIGTHVNVRFVGAPEPLGRRIKRRVQRAFIGRLSA